MPLQKGNLVARTVTKNHYQYLAITNKEAEISILFTCPRCQVSKALIVSKQYLALKMYGFLNQNRKNWICFVAKHEPRYVMDEWEPVHTIYLYFYKVFEKFLGEGGF